MQLYAVYLYVETALHVSDGTSAHHQECIQLYLHHLVFVTPSLLPAAIFSSTIAAGSSNGLTNTRCCRYSFTVIRHKTNSDLCLTNMGIERNHNSETISLWEEKFNPHSNIYVQQRCNVTQFILSGNCSTCFGWYHHPSSGAQTTVSTASGICQTVTATCRYSGREQ